MTDQMEMERLLKLEAFRSDFNRLSNGNSDSKKTNPIFDQLNSDNLLAEIKDPMVGEVWDDTKRLIDLANKVQTNEDLVEIEAKTRLVIEKIKSTGAKLDKKIEGESSDVFITVPADGVSERERRAGHLILGWLYNLTGPFVHATVFENDIDSFKNELVLPVKKEIE